MERDLLALKHSKATLLGLEKLINSTRKEKSNLEHASKACKETFGRYEVASGYTCHCLFKSYLLGIISNLEHWLLFRLEKVRVFRGR